jgi:beta-phosphoglucomutase
MNRARLSPLGLKVKAIIFDLDGVIVDSMPYHFLAWYEALRPFGLRVSCFEVYSREGERWDKTLSDLLSQARIKYSKRTLREIFLLRKKIFRKYFKRFIFPDALEVLFCLKKKRYSLGLVTGTPISEIKKILPERIRGLFSAIVAGDQVKRGKPHPEPFLEAAKRLRLSPSECLVIENAPLGIASAKKAGMFCIALATSLPAQYLKDADITVNSLKEALLFLEKACRRPYP